MRLVKQISIFVENKSGKLADILEAVGSEGINISALSIADTADFGVLRLIVNNPDEAYKKLKKLGFTVKVTDVIAIAVEDTPGGLAKELKLLKENGVFIEYMYAFIGKCDENALVIIRAENTEEALNVLDKVGIKTLDASEVYGL